MGKFHWVSLVLAILALLAAVVAFRDPAANLTAVTLVLGALAAVRGGFQIAGKWMLKDVPGLNTTLMLVVGIVNAVCGLLLLTHAWIGILLLPLLFALWFVVDSAVGLANLKYAKARGKGYFWFRLVLGALGVLVGVFLFIHPASAILTLSFLVGFYFMMLSIACFIDAFGSAAHSAPEPLVES